MGHNQTNDLFRHAKFGDKFYDKSGKLYYYHYCKIHKESETEYWKYHYLMGEPETRFEEFFGEFTIAPYDAYVEVDGKGYPADLKYYTNRWDENGPNDCHVIIKAND